MVWVTSNRLAPNRFSNDAKKYEHKKTFTFVAFLREQIIYLTVLPFPSQNTYKDWF